jgi:hypothetical protein
MPKRPFTVVIIMCRTANSTWVWAGSMLQLVTLGALAAVVVLISILHPDLCHLITKLESL